MCIRDSEESAGGVSEALWVHGLGLMPERGRVNSVGARVLGAHFSGACCGDSTAAA